MKRFRKNRKRPQRRKRLLPEKRGRSLCRQRRKTVTDIYLVGAVLSGYLGYLINGAWTEGIAFNDFMNRFNEVCAVPLPIITIQIQ